MSTSNEPTQWTKSHARRELRAWQQSGESMAAYARKRGYPAHRLTWWRKRLAAETQPPETTTVGLAPAVIMGGRRAPVVVSLADDGVRLEISDPGAVHPTWLAALASALRSGVSA